MGVQIVPTPSSKRQNTARRLNSFAPKSNRQKIKELQQKGKLIQKSFVVKPQEKDAMASTISSGGLPPGTTERVDVFPQAKKDSALSFTKTDP
jgi:hypothetical protein